jgi:hypothetical protein
MRLSKMLAFSPSLTCGLRVVPRAIDPAIRHGDGSKVNTVLELSQSESENTLERRLVPEGQPELSESEIDYTVNSEFSSCIRFQRRMAVNESPSFASSRA